MGYTRYWNRTNKPLTEEFVSEVKRIINDSLSKGIGIKGWDGTGHPVITTSEILFNGAIACEAFILTNSVKFDFCKTRRRPYDYTVREILKIAEKMGIVEDVASDGEYEEIISDEEYARSK